MMMEFQWILHEHDPANLSTCTRMFENSCATTCANNTVIDLMITNLYSEIDNLEKATTPLQKDWHLCQHCQGPSAAWISTGRQGSNRLRVQPVWIT